MTHLVFDYTILNLNNKLIIVALRLWDEGFDVWLPNERGTSFSNKHVNKTSNEFSYWDFSFDEVGYYDLSKQFQYINKVTKEKIIFLGHSLGTTNAFIYASSKPEEARSLLKTMILMSSSCFYEYATTPVKLLVPLEPFLKDIIFATRIGSFKSIFDILKPLSRVLFRVFPGLLEGISLLISFLVGWTPNESDPAILNFDVGIFINDVSWKLVFHYLQIIGTVIRFQKFDYGPQKNMLEYGSTLPPEYNLRNINVPTLLVSSWNDSLTTALDSDTIHSKLGDEARIYEPLKVYGLNHFDYHTGRHRWEIVLETVVQFIKQLP